VPVECTAGMAHHVRSTATPAVTLSDSDDEFSFLVEDHLASNQLPDRAAHFNPATGPVSLDRSMLPSWNSSRTFPDIGQSAEIYESVNSLGR
jgi:hypothetical protein